MLRSGLKALRLGHDDCRSGCSRLQQSRGRFKMFGAWNRVRGNICPIMRSIQYGSSRSFPFQTPSFHAFTEAYSMASPLASPTPLQYLLGVAKKRHVLYDTASCVRKGVNIDSSARLCRFPPMKNRARGLFPEGSIQTQTIAKYRKVIGLKREFCKVGQSGTSKQQPRPVFRRPTLTGATPAG